MTAPNTDDELVTRTVRSESGLLVGVDLVFEVNGPEVVAVRAASRAVVFAEKGFADPVEAWDELGEALATVPGLRLPEDWGTGRMRPTARSRSLARGRSSTCTGRRRGGGV